eukprot:EG_transcript_12159
MDVQLKLRAVVEEDSPTWDFRGCRLQSDGAVALAASLNQSKATHLDVTLSQLGAEGAKILAQTLAENVTVTQWDLRGNEIGADGAAAVATCLERNTTLQRLDVSYNQLAQLGVAALANSLPGNTTLRQLDLGGNGIGDDGAVCLARCLWSQSSLRQLDLSRNRIGDAGVEALARSLLQNTTLQELDLRVNDFGHDGAQALLTSLEHNTTLLTLHVLDNDIPDAVWVAIDDLLGRNRRLCGPNEGGPPAEAEPVASTVHANGASGSVGEPTKPQQPSVVAEAMRLLMVQAVMLEEANRGLQAELADLRRQNEALREGLAVAAVQEEVQVLRKTVEALPGDRPPQAAGQAEAVALELARLRLELARETNRGRWPSLADSAAIPAWLAVAVLVGCAAGTVMLRSWPRGGL